MREREDLVEQDFADKGWDYRYFFLPNGGESRLTLRRLLLLVDGLDRDSSRFWADVNDTERFTKLELITMTIFNLFSEKAHPFMTAREDQKKQADFEARKQQILAAERMRTRALGME
ncbi:hypothetical protein EU799_07450 [Corynebacterium silvaticum]|nr:hypothetical protein [Corynebacterium silvaticum]NON70028.1 hypothetical protein [Corynebacterium silvaticum]TFA91668.1 hypothetical protein EU802_10135 [Corynebacterium silvaticum]TFA95582.1 hypothetical protein EU799_07450 [Corynebacterium silvaticum]TNX84840.1 hypothetical protein FIT55_05185 [Corynebacterium silvaticum]